MDLNAKEIGKRIKTHRKAKHITQKELADIVGCAEMTISQYERGLYSPKTDMRVKIANALGVSYAVLFMDTTPVVFNSPEEFEKAWSKRTEEKDGVSKQLKVSYGNGVTNEVSYTFRQSGLSENEKNELVNYYNYLLYKRSNRPDPEPEE